MVVLVEVTFVTVKKIIIYNEYGENRNVKLKTYNYILWYKCRLLFYDNILAVI